MVDAGCDTTKYEMVPSNFVLYVDELGCRRRGWNLFVVVVRNKRLNDTLC